MAHYGKKSNPGYHRFRSAEPDKKTEKEMLQKKHRGRITRRSKGKKGSESVLDKIMKGYKTVRRLGRDGK